MYQLKYIVRWVFWLNVIQSTILLLFFLLNFVGGIYGKDEPEFGSFAFIMLSSLSYMLNPFINLMTYLYQFWLSVCLLIIFNIITAVTSVAYLIKNKGDKEVMRIIGALCLAVIWFGLQIQALQAIIVE